VTTLVLRLWLPDRPGALGAVATRVGAVRGDVVGIDIIDRGAGRAVDELVVHLPDGELEQLLLDEVRQVDGVDVEDVRRLDAPPEDPAVAALEVARAVTRGNGGRRAEALVQGAVRLVHAQWAALVDTDADEVLAAAGSEPPQAAWLIAFVRGATTQGTPAEHDELAVATLPDGARALVVSRPHLPLRGREREVLVGLAALA
jgi:hypothetical protein